MYIYVYIYIYIYIYIYKVINFLRERLLKNICYNVILIDKTFLKNFGSEIHEQYIVFVNN